VPAALREHVIAGRFPHWGHHQDPRFDRFLKLIEDTPALRAYARTAWMRYETALAAAIADETGVPHDDPACRALAHFSIEVVDLAFGGPDPERLVRSAFDLLEHGWDAVGGREAGAAT
jgi:hypothetical protein